MEKEILKPKLTLMQIVTLSLVVVTALLLVVIIILLVTSRQMPDDTEGSSGIETQEPGSDVKYPDIDEILEDIMKNPDSDEPSLGTRLGRLWNSGVHQVADVWKDFDAEVGVTDFFKGGLTGIRDALRLSSEARKLPDDVVSLFDEAAEESDVTATEIVGISIESRNIKVIISAPAELNVINFADILRNYDLIEKVDWIFIGEVDSDLKFNIDLTWR